jgi:hypothetical protein
MPTRGFTSDQIREMRELRKAGTPLREIASTFHSPISTIMRYVGDIEPTDHGEQTTVISPRELKDMLDQWSPALPWEGPPLPNWLVGYLKGKGILPG